MTLIRLKKPIAYISLSLGAERVMRVCERSPTEERPTYSDERAQY